LQFTFEPEKVDSSPVNLMPTINDQDINSGESTVDMFETPNSSFRNRRSTRRNVATSHSDIEFSEPKKARKKLSGPKVNYVKPVKKSKSRRKASNKKIDWTWTKLGWLACGALLIRLVLMEGGMIDFYAMDDAIVVKEKELVDLRKDNADLVREIKKIKTSPQYQKQLAREHLGVIARNEYLVLFARDN
jgi:cell division protein FtsB